MRCLDIYSRPIAIASWHLYTVCVPVELRPWFRSILMHHNSTNIFVVLTTLIIIFISCKICKFQRQVRRSLWYMKVSNHIRFFLLLYENGFDLGPHFIWDLVYLCVYEIFVDNSGPPTKTVDLYSVTKFHTGLICHFELFVISAWKCLLTPLWQGFSSDFTP